MNIIFVTRCYKPKNIQAIKDNLKEVFSKQTEHTYVQYLLVDMSYNQPEESFKCFEDEHTKVVFTYNKKDYYNQFGIDQLVNSISADQNSWVYILDDDNLITDKFPIVFNSCQDADVLIVKRVGWPLQTPLVVGKIIGKVDLCNYIVKLKVKQENNFYEQGKSSYAADGRFLQNLVIKQYKFKYFSEPTTKYSALSRPLKVLRKDL